MARSLRGAAATRALLFVPFALAAGTMVSTLQKGNVQHAVIAASMLAMLLFGCTSHWLCGSNDQSLRAGSAGRFQHEQAQAAPFWQRSLMTLLPQATTLVVAVIALRRRAPASDTGPLRSPQALELRLPGPVDGMAADAQQSSKHAWQTGSRPRRCSGAGASAWPPTRLVRRT